MKSLTITAAKRLIDSLELEASNVGEETYSGKLFKRAAAALRSTIAEFLGYRW